MSPNLINKRIIRTYSKNSEFSNFDLIQISSGISPHSVLVSVVHVNAIVAEPDDRLLSACDTVTSVAIIACTLKRIGCIGTSRLVSAVVCSQSTFVSAFILIITGACISLFLDNGIDWVQM